MADGEWEWSTRHNQTYVNYTACPQDIVPTTNLGEKLVISPILEVSSRSQSVHGYYIKDSIFANIKHDCDKR